MAYDIKLSVKGDHEAKLTSLDIHKCVKDVSIYMYHDHYCNSIYNYDSIVSSISSRGSCSI